jgi:outer membrane lipoprotein-sorting protein
VLQPAAQADSLDAVLSRMDKAAKDFRYATADLKQTQYTAVIKESSEETAVLRIKRSGKSVTAITEYTKPAVHAFLIKNKEVQVYSPKAKIVQAYDLGKYTSTIDEFVLLAFGTSGQDLRKNYDITLGGAETIGSAATTRLGMVPKSADAKKYITKIELWIKDDQGHAIREKITMPGGDYYLVDYSNVKLDAQLPDSAFDLKLPKDVTIVHPQKH